MSNSEDGVMGDGGDIMVEVRGDQRIACCGSTQRDSAGNLRMTDGRDALPRPRFVDRAGGAAGESGGGAVRPRTG